MLIDDFLPNYDVHERHRTDVHAPRERVYTAVRQLDISEAKLSMWLFRLRGLASGLRAPTTFTLEDFLDVGFTLLGEKPNEELLLGLVGQFWKPSGKLIQLPAADFRDFAEPGYTKAAWNFSLQPTGENRVRLETETRVQCTDATSRRFFKLYWVLVGPFSGLIRREVLNVIKRQAVAD